MNMRYINKIVSINIQTNKHDVCTFHLITWCFNASLENFQMEKITGRENCTVYIKLIKDTSYLENKIL